MFAVFFLDPCKACGILVPSLGVEPVSLVLGVLTTGQPGKSLRLDVSKTILHLCFPREKNRFIVVKHWKVNSCIFCQKL